MIEHAIPQNIMDYEFKLFAGLTLKQFIYVAVSGGFSFLLFMLNRNGLFPTFFAWLTIPVILVVGITLGLASFQGRTAEDWMSSFARATKVPLRRVWMKKEKIVKYDNFLTTKPELFPTYLAVYFYSQEEFRKIISKKMGPNAVQAITNNSPAAQVIPVNTPVSVIETITLTPSNAYEYAEAGVVLPSIPNTVAFKIMEDGIPMEGIVAYVKDMNETVVSALRSNADGVIYFNESFQNGNFTIDFQSQDEVQFPRIKIQFDGTTYPLINLTPNE